MAAARQCDICGKTYPMYNTKRDAKKVNGFMFLNIYGVDRYWHHDIQDCCPECMQSIQDHIKGLKNGCRTEILVEEDL